MMSKKTIEGISRMNGVMRKMDYMEEDVRLFEKGVTGYLNAQDKALKTFNTDFVEVLTRIDERLNALELASNDSNLAHAVDQYTSTPYPHSPPTKVYAATLQRLTDKLIYATMGDELLTGVFATDDYVRSHISDWILDVRDLVDEVLYGSTLSREK